MFGIPNRLPDFVHTWCWGMKLWYSLASSLQPLYVTITWN